LTFSLSRNLISNPGQERSLLSKPSNKASISQQPLNCSSEAITSEDLLSFIYGDKTNFEYQIVLDGDFSLPLYRERNFE